MNGRLKADYRAAGPRLEPGERRTRTIDQKQHRYGTPCRGITINLNIYQRTRSIESGIQLGNN